MCGLQGVAAFLGALGFILALMGLAMSIGSVMGNGGKDCPEGWTFLKVAGFGYVLIIVAIICGCIGSITHI